VAFALLIAVIGTATSTQVEEPFIKMLCLSVAGFGAFSSMVCTWALPTAFLTDAAAASGIAVVNSIGNLAGFLGLYLMGYIHDATGSFTGGLLCLSVLGLMGVVVALLLRVKDT
jgi:ACS family tartrate transporter-like MFS transporter